MFEVIAFLLKMKKSLNILDLRIATRKRELAMCCCFVRSFWDSVVCNSQSGTAPVCGSGDEGNDW